MRAPEVMLRKQKPTFPVTVRLMLHIGIALNNPRLYLSTSLKEVYVVMILLRSKIRDVQNPKMGCTGLLEMAPQT